MGKCLFTLTHFFIAKIVPSHPNRYGYALEEYNACNWLDISLSIGGGSGQRGKPGQGGGGQKSEFRWDVFSGCTQL